jgi:hypothetical protein
MLQTLADHDSPIHNGCATQLTWLTNHGGGNLVDRMTGAQAFRAQLVVREQRQLYDYWSGLSQTGEIPSRSDINPAKLPRLLPGISLIDVADVLEDSRVRLAGTRLRDIYDQEVTGMRISDLPCAIKQDYWLAAYRRTIDLATPTQGVVRGPLVNKEHVVQYWLKLPLRTSSDKVSMVLCYDHFASASELMHENELLASAS